VIVGDDPWHWSILADNIQHMRKGCAEKKYLPGHSTTDVTAWSIAKKGESLNRIPA
jgi:hypothetical protein